MRRYNEAGAAGIKNQRRGKSYQKRGKPPLLNSEQIEQLKQALKSRPSDGGIWTGPKVARWIEEKTGVEKVWNQRGWEYLKKCAYSWQRPRPKHKKADKEQQKEFPKQLKNRVEKVREENPKAQVEVWFFDEHRVGLKPILRKIWAPRGERPIAVVQHKYEWLYVYGFVEPKTGKTLWYLIPRVNTKWLSLVYEVFAKEAQVSAEKIILLVEDRAGWHRSEKTQVPAGIEIEYLPPYSPELQPAERLWILVDEPLVNKNFEKIEEIEELLANRCNVLREMREDIKNITNYHWLEFI